MLSQKNYYVIATGRTLSQELQSIIEKENTDNSKIAFEKLDLANTDIHKFIKNITTKYGHLYGVINNGGNK